MKLYLYRIPIFLSTMLVLLLVVSDLGLAQGPPGPSDKSLIDRLKRESGGPVRISYHAETGKVRFIGAAPNRAVRQPSVLGVDASPEEAGRGFLATYGKLFGLQDPARELAVMKSRTLRDGRAFVRFQQVYHDIPIMSGELIVQTDAGRNIISANGEILPELDLDLTPTISAEAARQAALDKLARSYDLSVNDLTASEPELWIYNPILLDGPGPHFSSLVWRMEVTPVELLPIRELVLVDAQQGFVALHFNQVDTVLDRVIYDNNNNRSYGLPGNGPVGTEGSPPAPALTDANLAYDYSGDTYNFYFSEHGRDSLNDAGMTLLSTTRYCPPLGQGTCPYQNAFWNGSQMVYGNGFAAADDVVGHELTHGVTEFTSNLNYFYQSGAINESLSDVWGEFIDQTNGSGTDTAGVKWLLGEDVPVFGAVRNMKNPPNFNDPDRMLSSKYWCGEYDSGGVHINSGVNNKAVYLMTDGDTFNGKTVTGLGITKVADLYYEAQTNLLTTGSNYNDLYDALIQASINLGYSGANQQEVRDALDAVEMNMRPCGDSPQVSLCPSGGPDFLYFNDLETAADRNKWTSAAIIGSDQWFWASDYASSGTYYMYGYNQPSRADFYAAMNSDVALPADAYMHFMHDWAFEDDYVIGGIPDETDTKAWDGGVLEYSTNGGSSWIDAGSLFIDNGYNGPILNNPGSPDFTDNPLMGRQAFTHEGHGYNASRLNLSSLAGRNVRFRFRIGTDSIVSAYGWAIDDVSIYTCPYPVISGLPGQRLPINSSANNAIDLWAYASDAKDSDSDLTFTITNSPAISAGVSIDSDRYIDINPAIDWIGTTNVRVQVEDTDGFTDTDTFQVSVQTLVYLPLITKSN